MDLDKEREKSKLMVVLEKRKKLEAADEAGARCRGSMSDEVAIRGSHRRSHTGSSPSDSSSASYLDSS